MSLEELKAQAEAEEETTEEEEPETQGEPEEEEPDNEPDTDEGSSDEEEGNETEDEPSDDFELELDGEPETGQQKPSPEDALVYKLTKQKAKAREYKSELEELKEELKALKEGRQSQPQTQSRPQQPAQQYPPVPVLYEDGIDTKEQYTQAYQRWMAECKAVDERNNQADQQKSEYKRQMEEMSLNMAKRVSKFATEHKMGSDYVANAVEKARQEVEEATGIEGSLAYMLDAVGEGSEKAAIWIGTEKGANDLTKIKQLLADDKSGLKAISYLTRIASRKPSTRRTSKAPAPDTPLKGDGSSASAKALQGKYDKATDPNELMKLRKKARELGVKLT